MTVRPIPSSGGTAKRRSISNDICKPGSRMKIEVYPDADAVAHAAAEFIAKEAREAVAARGKFVMAVSGGKTPWVMLRDLANENVPWNAVHVVQVDERVAPEGDPDRNLTHLRESLLEHAPLRSDQIHRSEERRVGKECRSRWSP